MVVQNSISGCKYSRWWFEVILRFANSIPVSIPGSNFDSSFDSNSIPVSIPGSKFDSSFDSVLFPGSNNFDSFSILFG